MNHPNIRHTSMTDSQLLAAFVSSHDQRAFTELVRKHERLVWSVCSRQLDNRCDIEDAFQTTFMLLASRAKRIRKPESLPHWLYGVAWKTAARIRKYRSNESLEGVELGAADGQPFDAIARKYEIETVDRQLKAMPEKDRKPLVLYYFSGLTVKQIAQQLGISVAAAEGRLRRARSKLRLELTNQGVLSSPLPLAMCLSFSFQTNPELIALTSERCVTAVAGKLTVGWVAGSTSAPAFSGTLSTGAKLMICKIGLSIAITTMLAISGLFHWGAFQGPELIAQEIAVAQQESPATSQVELQLDDDQQTRHNRELHRRELHHNIRLHVHQLHEHMHHLLMWFHGHELAPNHPQHSHRHGNRDSGHGQAGDR